MKKGSQSEDVSLRHGTRAPEVMLMPSSGLNRHFDVNHISMDPFNLQQRSKRLGTPKKSSIGMVDFRWKPCMFQRKTPLKK